MQGGRILKRTSVMTGLVMAGLLGTSGLAWSLDVGDIKQEWTVEGRKIAAERIKLPAYDEMVRIPAGSFMMGSDKKTDKNAYLVEMPQRSVYLDAYDIDKYEVTTVQYLKFVLATNRPPQVDWKFDGGNFQDTMVAHPIMHVTWYEADEYCKWAGKRLPTEAESLTLRMVSRRLSASSRCGENLQSSLFSGSFAAASGLNAPDCL